MKSTSLDKDRSDVAIQADGVVLEIGFGSGLNLPYYKNINKLYALDISQELYDLAQENISELSFPIEFIKSSAEDIPLSDNSIDSVVSTWSLCSIPNPSLALKEIFRVLKPDGKFSFVEHGKSPRSLVFKLQNFLTPASKRLAGGCHMNRDVEKLILNAGFEFEKLEKFAKSGQPLGFTYKGIGIAKK